ncbi:MAG: hypothetical protein ACLRSR_04200 [[Ruminococcus] lactaris]
MLPALFHRSKPVPLDESEMENLGINKEDVIMDLAVGDVVTVLSGAWKELSELFRQSMNRRRV